MKENMMEKKSGKSDAELGGRKSFVGKKTLKEIANELAIEEGLYTKEMVIKELENLVGTCGSQQAAADFLKVTQAYVSAVLRGSQEPGPKILLALGFSKVLRYIPKDELDDEEIETVQE